MEPRNRLEPFDDHDRILDKRTAADPERQTTAERRLDEILRPVKRALDEQPALSRAEQGDRVEETAGKYTGRSSADHEAQLDAGWDE